MLVVGLTLDDLDTRRGREGGGEFAGIPTVSANSDLGVL